ncbi:hypothetical protein L1049_001596 [Liquidambar formosana]|uniref:HMA domain-containing protein n=1 Tax=Liquidambar formosana TaxID=63359 RepID=A0AAP0N4M5_LIQFO
MAANDETTAVKKLEKSYFDVLGLCCSSEVPLIENILKPLEGVKDVSVIVVSKTVIVVHDSRLISQAQIVKALNQARLEANVRVKGEANYKKKWPSPFAVASGLLLLLSLLKFIYHPFQWVALAAVAVGIFPIARKAIVAINNFMLDVNVLAIVAVIGTIALKDYLEAGSIVFLFGIAEWLESRASHKATAVMSSLMSIAPQKAVIAETGEVVNADEVKVGTILAVKAGETIPIDGVVVDGKCEVDEKTLTGESFPVSKQMGYTVWSGTINLNGYIGVRTTVLAEDCVVAKMAKLVEEAQNKKSSTQRFIDKFAKYYTPAVFIISVCFAVIPALLRVRTQNHRGKSYKSSTARNNTNKHGCSTGGCQKICEPQKCSSQTCASKCQSGPFSSSSQCENNKCTESACKPDGCVGGDLCHEAKQSEQGHLNPAHTASEQGQQMTNSGHCHMVHCGKIHVKDQINDKDFAKTEETSCDCQPENQEVCCKSGTALHETIDNASSSGHVESTAMHACMSLEKRESGGCCKSIGKECCAKSGHSGFGGGLSEILIE